MGLSSAIDWWDEWKLRILVLCSLSVQFVLLFSGYVHQWFVLRRLRVMVWIAYIGGDALAVYALATLFNRQKQQQTMADGEGGGSALEVLWAPVLLIHLGGQMQITAYSLEDNELWKRHAITLVSQVTVALYVFCKWWSGEKRLLKAAVLLFIVGILRFAQKPLALRRASYGSTASAYYLSSQPPRTEEESTTCLQRLVHLCTSFCIGDFRELVKKNPGEETINYSLEEYLRKALEHVNDGPKESDETQQEKFLLKAQSLVSKDIYKMFLDVAAPYSIRLYYLQFFLNLGGESQHKVLGNWIDFQYLTIYTKLIATLNCLGLCTLLVLPSLPLASLVLFAKSDMDGYDKSDIRVTYILFLGTVVMELAPFFTYLLRESLFRCGLASRPLFWQDMVAQHNIMSFCARKKKPPTLMKLATFSYLLRDLINKHWYIWYKRAAQQISMLVRRHVEDGWKNKYITDPDTYRRFNNLRGDHTLMKKNHHLLQQEKLVWTFNLPFDEYVLLGHLATDLCIHHPNVASSSEDQPIPCREYSVIISNYMIYLLFICPEMLIHGARHDLFILACDDIEHIIKNQQLPSLDERSIAQRVLRMGQEGDERMRGSPMISNAYKLAKALTDLNNNTEMWEVIQGVWVEMLCYSASRCRGYLHAKSLGVAGEFLTNVWLLWWCMGMQTLPDMMNNLGPPEGLTVDAASV